MSLPYKLYGQTELNVISDLIQKRIQKWMMEWSGQKNSIENIELIADESLELDGFYSAEYELDGGNFCLSVDASLYLNFPGLILPTRSSVKHYQTSMTEKILNNVFLDLVSTFIKSADITSLEKTNLAENYFDSMSVSSISGDLIIKVGFAQGDMYLKLPYSALERLNTYKHKSNENSIRIHRRSECAITGNMALSVDVGGAEVDFGSVVGMQKGDVIRLDSKITDVMKVTTDDGDFICNAHLGKQGNNKAIKVIF